MEEIYKNLASLSWWVGVVVVSIALNLISAYMKTPLDSVLSSLSSRWQRRSARAREQREAQVAHLKSDQHAQVLLIADEMRHRLRHVALLLLSIFFLLFYVYMRLRVPSTALVADPVLLWSSRTLYW